MSSCFFSIFIRVAVRMKIKLTQQKRVKKLKLESFMDKEKKIIHKVFFRIKITTTKRISKKKFLKNHQY